MNQKQKQQIQQKLFQYSLRDMYAQMMRHLDKVPEGANLDRNDEAAYHCQNVWAIEEEWILDPELRAELSLLDTQEDEED